MSRSGICSSARHLAVLQCLSGAAKLVPRGCQGALQPALADGGGEIAAGPFEDAAHRVGGADGGARVPHQQARVRQRALARGVLGGEVRVGQLLELLYSVHEVSIWCYNFYTATARLCA